MGTETPETIMDATGRVLCRHGYAGLTMQRIADEADMTAAAIHYHYDTKAELLNAFLNDLIEDFERRLTGESDEPGDRLLTVLEAVFASTGETDEEFPVAIMELKAQAPYEERFRERFRELDAAMREVVASIVADGVEAGVFETVDPQTVARTVTTLINGSHVRTVALGEDPEATRAIIERYLADQLGWQPEVVA